MIDFNKENPDFIETVKNVEIILERLTFHIFEEVMIWSNEHVSKAFTQCVNKTVEEFKSGKLVLTKGYPQLKCFQVDNVINGLHCALCQSQEHQDNLYAEITELKAKLAKYESQDFVAMPKSELEACYLDESEGMYLTDADFLADIDIGEAVEVERQYYWKTTPLFAAITWDEPNNDVGYYEFYDTQEEAEKAAAHCKAMVEAAKENNHE